jgi:hypothetical protein
MYTAAGEFESMIPGRARPSKNPICILRVKALVRILYNCHIHSYALLCLECVRRCATLMIDIDRIPQACGRPRYECVCAPSDRCLLHSNICTHCMRSEIGQGAFAGTSPLVD